MSCDSIEASTRLSKMNVVGYVAWSCGPAQVVAVPLTIAVLVTYVCAKVMSCFAERETPIEPLNNRKVTPLPVKEQAEKPKPLETPREADEAIEVEANVPPPPPVPPIPLKTDPAKEEESRYNKLIKLAARCRTVCLYSIMLPFIPVFGTYLSYSISGRTFKKQMVELKDIASDLYDLMKKK